MKPFKLTRLSYIDEAAKDFNPEPEYDFKTDKEFVLFFLDLPRETMVHFNSSHVGSFLECSGFVDHISTQGKGHEFFFRDGRDHFYLDDEWIKILDCKYNPSENLLTLSLKNGAKVP